MTHDEPGPGQTYALHARQATAGRNLPSRSRSAGARRTKESQEMRPRTGGPNRPPANRTTTGSSGWRLPTAPGCPYDRHPYHAYDAGRRKEAAGSAVLVRAETPQQRVCAPEERQAGPDPRQGGEADGLQILPAQVWACPNGRVPQEHGQQIGRPLLVVRPGEH